ncbi:MAG: glucose-6-phosphate isomerase [Gammaproteobacteria bacterium]
MTANIARHIAEARRCADALDETPLSELFEREPERMARLVVQAAGLTLDCSKQRLDSSALDALGRLAQAVNIGAARDAMLAGEPVNRTEKRAVLHTALRAGDGRLYATEIDTVLEHMGALVEDVRQGRRRGFGGAQFTDVVNIGIGGSHLGPALACDALRYDSDGKLRTHFLANVDGGEFDRITAHLNPASTLFIVASKSFSTVETRLNAQSARAWLAGQFPQAEAVADHFVAVSARPERAVEFGIAEANVFPMWDWVGGRYSLWSAIGLPIAFEVGMTAFRALLAGAAGMDEHFATAPLLSNMPVMLGLIGFWNSHCLGAESYAVVPYDDRLRLLPDYLQQLEMESNGKRVDLTNAVLDGHSAPVTWGGLGTNAQHAFFQLLHQGTRLVPVDFIVAMQHPANRRSHHDMLVANCLAQAEALMRGQSYTSSGLDEDGIDLARHRESPGNRPSNMLVMDALTPATLGALIALYEHKTFVQSVIWNINAFDQWGVELGKQLATTILDEITGSADQAAHDPSTSALVARYRAAR